MLTFLNEVWFSYFMCSASALHYSTESINELKGNRQPEYAMDRVHIASRKVLLASSLLSFSHTQPTAFWKRYTYIFPLIPFCIHRFLFCFYSLISGIQPGILSYFALFSFYALLPRQAESMSSSQSTKHLSNARKFESNTDLFDETDVPAAEPFQIARSTSFRFVKDPGDSI